MATPPINAIGLYEVKTPFAVVSGAVYKCESIRGFDELEEEGINVYQKFYSPLGIDSEVYEQDRLDGVDIVYLMSMTADSVVIPSSFIVSFPNAGTVDYKETYIMFNLGLLPDEFDLESIQDYCIEAIEASVGVEVESKVIANPVIGAIDESTHEALTNARMANVNTPDSHYKRNIDMTRENQQLRQKLEALQQELLKYI